MKLFVGKTAQKQLLKIPYRTRGRIEAQIEKLEADPFPPNARKLSGRPGWRLRTGDYRTIYFVDKKKKRVIVLNVAHRRDAYRGI